MTVASNFAMRARRSRFQVAPKIERTIDGVVFASKKEAARYGLLKLREKIGEISDLKLQPRFPVEIGGERLCVYTADFSYYDRQLGRVVIEDSKSTGTAKDAAYRLRKRAAELAHGITVDEVIK
jgi:Protein of unknown function (DUF1064)